MNVMLRSQLKTYKQAYHEARKANRLCLPVRNAEVVPDEKHRHAINVGFSAVRLAIQKGEDPKLDPLTMTEADGMKIGLEVMEKAEFAGCDWTVLTSEETIERFTLLPPSSSSSSNS